MGACQIRFFKSGLIISVILPIDDFKRATPPDLNHTRLEKRVGHLGQTARSGIAPYFFCRFSSFVWSGFRVLSDQTVALRSPQQSAELTVPPAAAPASVCRSKYRWAYRFPKSCIPQPAYDVTDREPDRWLIDQSHA